MSQRTVYSIDGMVKMCVHETQRAIERVENIIGSFDEKRDIFIPINNKKIIKKVGTKLKSKKKVRVRKVYKKGKTNYGEEFEDDMENKEEDEIREKFKESEMEEIDEIIEQPADIDEITEEEVEEFYEEDFIEHVDSSIEEEEQKEDEKLEIELIEMDDGLIIRSDEKEKIAKEVLKETLYEQAINRMEELGFILKEERKDGDDLVLVGEKETKTGFYEIEIRVTNDNFNIESNGLKDSKQCRKAVDEVVDFIKTQPQSAFEVYNFGDAIIDDEYNEEEDEKEEEEKKSLSGN